MPKEIEQLIVCSAYAEPSQHWEFNPVTQEFNLEPGRRVAEYIMTGENDDASQGEGQRIELKLVNKIRPRVKEWRQNGYPGTTAVTRKLLDWWHASDVRENPFFFCELDAIETLIWLVEAPATTRVGIDIPTDGGLFQRVCTKLCTGGGKTIVMAMLIAWQLCNKATYPFDKRFSKNVLVVAPGLTVRDRLKVLELGDGDSSYYVKFNVVPQQLLTSLRQGSVLVANWQSLTWETEKQIAKRKSVDKRGALSDRAYVRSILGDMANRNDILVINDEAHHAWRKNPDVKNALKGEDRREYIAQEQEATLWISALDRIHRTIGIQCCYDFSATPFAPSGRRNNEEALYGWIVSDFSLNDGIESGLVKTPRIVVKDNATFDSRTEKSALYHLYQQEGVRENLVKPASPETPLPDLVRNAYLLLANDWDATFKEWMDDGSSVPPVMISVVNRTETAARIEYAFEQGHSIQLADGTLNNPRYTMRIDSKLLGELDSGKQTKSAQALELRNIVNTVGQPGKPGAEIRHVISVGMLSEGWDAHTVTHIMGLRAFTSQLLCEQVIGRGLRRTSYDVDPSTGLFTPEYVNVFGIPFEFLPHEGDGGKGANPKPKTMISVVQNRNEYEITWPNVLRVNERERANLCFNVDDVPPLQVDTSKIISVAGLGNLIDSMVEEHALRRIDLTDLGENTRLQTIVFYIVRNLSNVLLHKLNGSTSEVEIVKQVVNFVQEFITRKDKIIGLDLFSMAEVETDPSRRNVVMLYYMSKIVTHLFNYITLEETSSWEPVISQAQRIRSTADMATWYTSKKSQPTVKSQISHCVEDSQWEGSAGWQLDNSPHVKAWVKNDAHIGFSIEYIENGELHHYIPDFLIKLVDDTTLVLEIKGRNSESVQTKRRALQQWIEAVNSTHEYGVWKEAIAWNTTSIENIIEEARGRT